MGECFNEALDCLSRTNQQITDHAIERAKIVVKTLFKTVKSALDMKQIITAGPFVYYIIKDVSENEKLIICKLHNRIIEKYFLGFR